MIKTYFFVPLTNEKFIQNAQKFDVDYLVYDLEDAISNKYKVVALNNIGLIKNKTKCYIRPTLNWNEKIFKELDHLYHQGFQKFVIPKAESISQIELLIKYCIKNALNIKFILLVENPKLLFELFDIIRYFNSWIIGLSLGSHDYCSYMGAKYEYNSFQFAHDYILNMCKSFDIEAIDVASMHIVEKESFTSEVLIGFNKGYRSKFILHPFQLNYLNDIKYYDEKEIEFAKLVNSKFNLQDDLDAIKINGRILEKPHIERIKEILKYINYGTK